VASIRNKTNYTVGDITFQIWRREPSQRRKMCRSTRNTTIQGGPKVGHYHKSSLNRIKTRH